MLKMSGNSNKQKKHCYICAHFKIIIMIFFILYMIIFHINPYCAYQSVIFL